MVETMLRPVAELVDHLDGIERETEGIYLRLGRMFPEMKSAVDASAQSAETTIRTILSSYRGGVSADIARRRMVEFIEDATRFFANAAETENRFFDGVETGIGSLSKLDGIIDRVREDSEEMEIVSLNAMTVALKSGSAGRAFSVITDELKRLSGKTIQHANDLSSAGTELLDGLDNLRRTLEDLAGKQEHFFGTVKETLDGGFKRLDAEVAETAATLRAMASQASGVRGPVSEIMQGVQLQDIIRQSLDHVRLSLRASEQDATNGGGNGNGNGSRNGNGNGMHADEAEERAFLAEITRLSASLLDDVHAQVLASLARFESSIQAIQQIMSEVESHRDEDVGRRRACADGVDFAVIAADYLKTKDAAASQALRIGEGVRRLDERFRAVNSILTRFKNIVTASRIETARNKALAIVSNTVQGMMDLTERLAMDIAEAGEVTRSFSKTMNTEMGDYLNDLSDRQELIVAEIDRMGERFRQLEESRQSLCDAESDFQPFSSGFIEAIQNAAAETRRIAALANELAAMRDELSAYAESTGGSDADGFDLNIRNERLKSIVERFTIFTHRQEAVRIAHLGGDVEQEADLVESGDVTLF
ncbi:MAG: methyl-accepting chemotaxis protein [Clostridia bacterium]|jgi:hypothetical protein|nr:methyl-accepting chemotaxis protein [Spirochaetia bacterium]